MLALKKLIFQEITCQRNHRLFIRIPTYIKKIGRKITMVFHCFEEIQKYTEQLLYTNDIHNIEEAINVYDKFEKKIILDWPLCESSHIILVLPKLKPSKHLLVLKASSTRLQRNNFTSSKTSQRRLAKTS